MEKNEIKKVLYKEKPTAFREALVLTEGGKHSGSVCYTAFSSVGQIEFVIPKEEAVDFGELEPAQLLIRWMI